MIVWGLHYPAAHSTDTQAASAPTRQAHVRQNLTPGAPWSKPRPLGEQHKQAVCVAAISVDRATLRRDAAQAQCVRSPAHALQREGRNVVTPELAWGARLMLSTHAHPAVSAGSAHLDAGPHPRLQKSHSREPMCLCVLNSLSNGLDDLGGGVLDVGEEALSAPTQNV